MQIINCAHQALHRSDLYFPVAAVDFCVGLELGSWITNVLTLLTSEIEL